MLKEIKNPITFASGYSLDMYCKFDNDKHSFQEFPHQYLGETFKECADEALREGWKINYKTRLAICPKCAKLCKDLIP